ncbi:NirD/YgiW/YdeI family stress tolerance protein [Vibrio sp. ZSDE26]|uniref:NirD/YgiW/YdeI family stress tolerance protein n=2 Tax=Vibrio amylolyticus TaxID=2847292 RepID=A0A9X1XKK7_9VIBR|nr:NirD/YgiW/YdeI family stress tolerance protein [Vibrio amylolyticus]MCK6263613.1 NirD/YgiW/YdeI family stress tolerance protein [Vibrio amylolyticus]
MKLITLAAVSTLTLATAPAFAKDKHKGEPNIQYTGPIEVTTVNQIAEDASLYSDSDVVLEGHLVKQISKDRFIFADATGEIQVELDDIILAQPLSHETTVRIFGEYETGSTPEVEVEHLVVL